MILPRSLPTQLHAMRRDTRGQTINDFFIGAVIFLVATGFIFSIVPTILAPFGTTDDSGVQIRADRTADHLLNGPLTEGESDAVLEAPCVKAFFQNTTNSACPEYDPQSLAELTGNTDGTGTRVQILNSNDTVASYDGVTLERGDEPHKSATVSVASRTVSLNGNTYHMNVYVWK